MSLAFWTDVLINFCPPNQKIVPAPLVRRSRLVDNVQPAATRPVQQQVYVSASHAQSTVTVTVSYNQANSAFHPPGVDK